MEAKARLSFISSEDIAAKLKLSGGATPTASGSQLASSLRAKRTASRARSAHGLDVWRCAPHRVA
jgi:hypothetical protein